MKKRRLLYIIIAALTAGSMLTACSSNTSSGTDLQEDTSQTQSISDTSENT